jgi:hypothetical protein
VDIVTPQGAALVFFGIIICFMGYSLFRSMLPLWGFILFGILAITGLPFVVHLSGSQLLIAQIVTFLVAGLIGALIATPLYYVIVFLTGALLGGLVGMVLGAYLNISGGVISFRALTKLAEMNFPPPVDTPTQWLIMVILGLVTGIFAINFQKFMISASTAFLGSAGVVSGMNTILLGAFRSVENRSILIGITWLILGMIGMFVQYRMRDET